MEAEKAHDLPSASWRTRKAGGAISSESKSMRHRGAMGGTPSLRLKAWEPGIYWCKSSKDPGNRSADARRQEMMHIPAQEVSEGICSSFAVFFCSGLQWIGWCPTMSVRQIFIQSPESNTSLFLKHPHRHTQKCVASYLGIP